MKILIQNYSNEISTEPLYLDKCFNEAGIGSAIWNDKQLSAFDALDKYCPNVLLFHTNSKCSKDILKYCKTNKKIDVCINITGLSQVDVNLLDSIIDFNKVNLKFYYSNHDQNINEIKSKNKIINLLPGVDCFSSKYIVPNFNVKTAIITCQNFNLIKDFCKNYDTYHTINIGNKSGFDININILNMKSLYEKYDEIIIFDIIENIFNQLFFESSFFAKKTTLQCDNRNVVNKNLAKLFSSEDEKENIDLFIKEKIKQSHTCYDRAKKILYSLKETSKTKTLEQNKNAFFDSISNIQKAS